MNNSREVNMREFDLKEVAEFDGKDGKPVYIVHQGKVYDVTESKLWKGGLHMRRHSAGTDLTADFPAAPHGTEVLARYPQVGIIKGGEETAGRTMWEPLSRLITRFPMLSRHPHPMTVHFPIGFFFATSIFTVLYAATGLKSFESTAFHCMMIGLLFTPIVVLTGLFSWWLNYMAKPMRPVRIKIWLSIVLWVTVVITATWRMTDPHVLNSFRSESVVYFLFCSSFAPLVTALGWFGAKLTFPTEKK